MEDVILLVGAPNAGKSTCFNALTGGHARVGNWHGVTVGALEGKIKGRGTTVVDLPGIYSLSSMSMEEKFTRDYLAARPHAAVLFVSECAALPRTAELMRAMGERRCALLLTKRRAFLRAGGRADAEKISASLGVPVLDSERLRGKKLREAVSSALSSKRRIQRGEIAGFSPAREGLGPADRLLLNGFFTFPLFFLLLVCAFLLTFAKGFPGDLMKEGIEHFFSEFLGGFAEKIPSPAVRSLVRDGLLGSVGGVLGFLPQIALLYFFLILMEESGFLSRLAALADGFLSLFGLNGRAVFSLLLGFGCTAAAILTTRGLDDKRIQRRVILCLPYISCSAKLPVYLVLSASFFADPFLAVLLLYLLGVMISLLVALFLKGETPPFVLELAPLQIPRPLFVAKSLLLQVKQFIIKTATVILAFFLLSWGLSSFDFSFHFCGAEESMLATVCGWLKWLFAPIGMADWRIAYAALSGLVAKENVAATISLFFGEFPYPAASAFAFAVFILTCSPCVSAIASTARELGWGRAILYAGVQTGSALLLSYLAYFTLKGGVYLLLPVAALACAVLILGRKKGERIRRRKRANTARVHG